MCTIACTTHLDDRRSTRQSKCSKCLKCFKNFLTIHLVDVSSRFRCERDRERPIDEAFYPHFVCAYRKWDWRMNSNFNCVFTHKYLNSLLVILFRKWEHSSFSLGLNGAPRNYATMSRTQLIRCIEHDAYKERKNNWESFHCLFPSSISLFFLVRRKTRVYK